MRRREGMVDEEREQEIVKEEEEERRKMRRRRGVSDILTEGKLEQASSGRYYAASILDCSPLIPHAVWYIRLQNKNSNNTLPGSFNSLAEIHFKGIYAPPPHSNPKY